MYKTTKRKSEEVLLQVKKEKRKLEGTFVPATTTSRVTERSVSELRKDRNGNKRTSRGG